MGEGRRVNPGQAIKLFQASRKISFTFHFRHKSFILDDVKLAELSDNSLNERMWHFRGSKHTLTPPIYFRGEGSTPQSIGSKPLTIASHQDVSHKAWRLYDRDIQKNDSRRAVAAVSTNGSWLMLIKINVKNCSLSTTYNGDMTHRKQQK